MTQLSRGAVLAEVVAVAVAVAVIGASGGVIADTWRICLWDADTMGGGFGKLSKVSYAARANGRRGACVAGQGTVGWGEVIGGDDGERMVPRAKGARTKPASDGSDGSSASHGSRETPNPALSRTNRKERSSQLFRIPITEALHEKRRQHVVATCRSPQSNPVKLAQKHHHHKLPTTSPMRTLGAAVAASFSKLRGPLSPNKRQKRKRTKKKERNRTPLSIPSAINSQLHPPTPILVKSPVPTAPHASSTEADYLPSTPPHLQSASHPY